MIKNIDYSNRLLYNYNERRIRKMSKSVETKRVTIAFCTYKDLIDKFHEQSRKMNESMSRRIENFIKEELKKEEEKK